jgi:acyl carrier protein
MSSRAGHPRANPSEVHAQLAEIVRLVTGTPVDQVGADAAFVDDLRIDSLSMVEILEGASRHFGVRIEDEDAKDFVHVHELVGYISRRLGQSQTTS